MNDLKNLNLPAVQFGDRVAYLLKLPHPPQLFSAIGYAKAKPSSRRKTTNCANALHSAHTIGVWIDNQKVTVSDGYQTFIASNPGWDAYCNHHAVSNYLLALRCFGSVKLDFYGSLENYGRAQHGFLLDGHRVYLAEVEEILQILSQNPDRRPQWLQNASQDNLLNPLWQKRYQEYSAEQSSLFPKHNNLCRQTTAQMLEWLENRHN